MKQIVALLICVAASTVFSFEHGVVYRMNRPDNINVENFGALSEYISLQMGEHVDVWNSNQKFIDVQVPEEFKDIFEEFMKAFSLEPKIIVEDVERLIYETTPKKSKNVKDESFNYTTYNDLDTINQWTSDMAANYDFVTLETVGSSYLGKTINGIKISTNPNAQNAVVLNTGIHAREWIGPAHLILFTKMLIDNYNSGNQQVTELLNEMDLFIIPISNPDGYEYTWTDGGRMWRKTRSDNGLRCDGVDPNRNWDAHWDQPNGASTNPCSDAFKGPSVWSEIEVRSLRDYVNNIAEEYTGIAFCDLHSYSQLWMYPYGYQHGAPAYGSTLHTISQNIVNAIYDTYGTEFTYGPIADTIYVASGSTVDYFLDTSGINCGFAAELRDTGRYGFLLPERYIQPSAEEMYNAYMVLFQAVTQGYCPKVTEQQ